MTDLIAENARLRAALEAMLHAVCSDSGFAAAVRQVSGLAYPWPALDDAEANARAALATPAHDAVQEAARDVDLLFDAYKGLLVLFRVLDKAGLTAGADTTNALANAIVAKHPEFPARAALRATVSNPKG